MRLFIILSLLLFAQFTLIAQPISRLDGSQISNAELDEEIQRLQEAAQVHGLAISIFNDNRLVYRKTFGYKNYEKQQALTDSTNIYGASLSKAVFGVLVMKLVEEGVLELDTPMQNYLPKPIYEYTPQTRWHDDYSDLKDDSLYQKITARMCLNHTTGMPNWRWYEPGKKLRIKYAPGSRYNYSGEGLVYLQVVLEKMTGRSLESLAQEYVFQPLNMENSSYGWQPAFKADFAYGHVRTGAHYPKDIDNEARSASTLETTLTDYSKFLEAALQEKLLTADSWEQIFSPGIRIRSLRQFGPLAAKDGTLNEDIQLAYGLGWGLIETPYGTGAFKEGGGSGFHHYSILFPEAGIDFLLMTNSENGPGIYEELLKTTIGDTYSPMEWNNYIPYQELAAVPDSLFGYACPPCKKACDQKTFDKAGYCPDCDMMLQPKIALGQ